MKQFFFLYVIFYEFAQLGMIWFGGKLTFEVYETLNMPAYYYKMNFNDFFSAIIVLFQQMVVNNWYAVVNMTADYMGNNKQLIRLFFICFWVLVVLILLNIIVAVVLEVHASFQVEVSNKFKMSYTTQRLHRMLHDDDRMSMKKKLRDAR